MPNVLDESHPPSTAEVGSAAGVYMVEDAGPLPPLGPLTARASEADYFSVPRLRSNSATYPPSTRNPFLFLDEQVEGLDWAGVVAKRTRVESEGTDAFAKKEPDDPDAIEAANRDLRIATARRTVASLRLSAVLIAKDGGSAIVNGDVVTIGSRVNGSDLVLVAVSSRGVEFASDGVRIELALPDASTRRRTAESGHEIEKSTLNDGEERP